MAVLELAGFKRILPSLAPWVPSDLFAQGQQGFWLPFTDFASLSQDSAGTLPYTALEQPVGRVLDRSGRGNHASQVTSTARGVVSARVNLLTYSEDFTQPVYGKVGATVSPNTALAPDGTMTADTATLTGGDANLTYGYAGYPAVMGRSVTMTLRTRSAIRSSGFGGASALGTDVIAITDIGGGWYEQKTTRTFTETTSAKTLQVICASQFWGALSEQIIWGASLTIDPLAPYQRIEDANTYATAGFPKYLRLDGTDDFYTCGGGGSTTGFYYADVILPRGGAGTVRFIMSDRTTGNVGIMLSINALNKLELAVGNTTTYVRVSSTETLDVGTAYWIEALDDGVNLQVRVNNGAPVSVPRPTPTAGGSILMLYKHIPGNDAIFNGQITEPIYRAGPPPSAYERGMIRTYQMQKAGMA